MQLNVFDICDEPAVAADALGAAAYAAVVAAVDDDDCDVWASKVLEGATVHSRIC